MQFVIICKQDYDSKHKKLSLPAILPFFMTNMLEAFVMSAAINT